MSLRIQVQVPSSGSFLIENRNNGIRHIHIKIIIIIVIIIITITINFINIKIQHSQSQTQTIKINDKWLRLRLGSEAKVKAISQFGPIDTLKKVQTFLGMLAFISSFIPHFSTACYPLYALLKDQKTKKFELTKEAMVAYDTLKEFLKKETINYHPDFTKPLYLAVDARQCWKPIIRIILIFNVLLVRYCFWKSIYIK